MPGIFTDRNSALFKTLKPLTALLSAHTVLPVCLVKQLKCICNMFTKFAEKFHTHTHTHTRVVLQTLSLSLCHQSDEQLVHAHSSAVVTRRLMLIAKRDKWQFVVKTLRQVRFVAASRSLCWLARYLKSLVSF